MTLVEKVCPNAGAAERWVDPPEAVWARTSEAIVARTRPLFWRSHDPTQGNRQGPDVGSQYRSAVYFNSPEQEEAAVASKARVQAQLPERVTTEVVPAETFYEAEDYHQQYFEKQGRTSCHVGLRSATA